jgi:hypothetical protein
MNKIIDAMDIITEKDPYLEYSTRDIYSISCYKEVPGEKKLQTRQLLMPFPKKKADNFLENKPQLGPS